MATKRPCVFVYDGVPWLPVPHRESKSNLHGIGAALLTACSSTCQVSAGGLVPVPISASSDGTSTSSMAIVEVPLLRGDWHLVVPWGNIQHPSSFEYLIWLSGLQPSLIMYFKLHSVVTPLLLATQAQVFVVTFYLGNQCHGARVGIGSYSHQRAGFPLVCFGGCGGFWFGRVC